MWTIRARRLTRSILAAAMIAFLPSESGLAETVRMVTGPPGSSVNLVMTSLATSPTGLHGPLAGIDLVVIAGGNTARQMVETARGGHDIVLATPGFLQQMMDGGGVFGRLPEAPALSRNLGLLFWFPGGAWHVAVRAGSGIDRLSDLRGRRVWPGRPRSDERDLAIAWIRAVTGLVPGDDFVVVRSEPREAQKAFLSGDIDAWVSVGIPPFREVAGLARSSPIRLLGLEPDDAASPNEAVLALNSDPGLRLETIDPGIYSRRVVNDGPVHTLGTIAGVMARMDVAEQPVYGITRSFWEIIGTQQQVAPYLRRVSLDAAFDGLAVSLHPGALRYYREIGLEIPKGFAVGR